MQTGRKRVAKRWGKKLRPLQKRLDKQVVRFKKTPAGVWLWRFPAWQRWSALAVIVVLLIGMLWWPHGLKADLKSATYRPQIRTYYVAAEKVTWDYAPGGVDLMTGHAVPQPWGAQTAYQKVRYIEYTDASFTKKKPQPDWLGILGPIIRGVPGDTIKVVFKNRADLPYSMHPHGLKYDKDNEGSTAAMIMGDEDEAAEMGEGSSAMDMPGHDMSAMPGMSMPMVSPSVSEAGSSDTEDIVGGVKIPPVQGAGAAIAPGKEFTYTWHVRNDAGPAPGEGGSRVWLYHSHVAARDIYDGLVGAIVITDAKHARADASPDDVDHEFISLFMVFDESQPGMDDVTTEGSMKHAINGRIFDNLPAYRMKEGEKVRWYELGLGNEVDLHTAHWHGNVVADGKHKTDDVELLPASMKTVDMIADQPGSWAYHCHVLDHMEAGMMAMYIVDKK